MRGRMDELIIPPELEARDIAGYLDDIFHEYAGSVIAWDGLRTDQTLPT